MILMAGVVLALRVRLSLLDFSSADYWIVLRKWFETLLDSGFSALGGNFYNYTPAYLYVLYLSVRLMLVLPLSGKRLRMVGLKLPSTIGDFFLAGFAAAIVRKKYSNPFVWLATFLSILLTPTVVLNSAAWGQADVLYTTALLACIYFLLCNRPNLAVFAFGVAFSFKLQATFLFPCIIALCLMRWIPWKSLLWIPLVYLLSVLPAWLAGRPMLDLLTIYLVQSGEYHNLVNNAPNFYLWLPQSAYQVLFPLGLIFSASIVFLFLYGVYKSKAQVTQDLIIQLATFSVLLVPFVLPKMHERYFYPADVLSIIYAFYFPRYFYLPFLVVLASLFAYLPFLYFLTPVPLILLPVLTLTALTLVMINLLRALYPHGILSMQKAPKNL
jgi:Gpi18-like mannosyltransferase